jgi:alpha-tubulin suppressor-like RCC1 family protein
MAGTNFDNEATCKMSIRRAMTIWVAAPVAVLSCGTRTGLLVDERDPVGADAGGGPSGDAGGFGGTPDAAAPDATGPEAGIPMGTTMLALGSYHTCSVRIDNAVYCWGGNTIGQIGDGTDQDRPQPTRVPLPFAGVMDLQAGFRHTCVALVTGDVYCWGENLDGQIGPAELGAAVRTPVRVDLPQTEVGGVVGLAAGEYHTCANYADGRLFCWGSDKQGQLGVGEGSTRVPPTEVAFTGSVVKVGAGDFFTCAMVQGDESKRVSCFGQNHRGQLGDGTFEDRPFPEQALFGAVFDIDVGGFFVLAAPESGDTSLFGWGENSYGQLGPTTLGEDTPDPVEVTPPWNLIDFSAGLGHACAARWSEERPWDIVCWGGNGQGQLGDGTTVSRAEPRVVEGLDDVIRVEAGLLHTCASTLEGKAYCWGANEFGQLGDGTTVESLVPVRVEGL